MPGDGMLEDVLINSLPELSVAELENSNVPAVPLFLRNWFALPLPAGNVSVLSPAVAGAVISEKPELLPFSLKLILHLR